MNLRIEKGGRAITSTKEWFDHAPPMKGERQWVDGRSAKELAKLFLAGGAPETPLELRNLLASQPSVGAVELTVGYPEMEIPLDDFRGGTRNADLALLGSGHIGRVAINIEAKADESFGPTIGEALASVRAKPTSKLPNRVAALATAMFGHARPEIHNLRYQLLHGVAASLIFAREHGAAVAVFVVLEFHGEKCKRDNIAGNKSALDAFMQTLAPGVAPLIPGTLSEALTVPGSGFVPRGIFLFVGKVIRQLPCP
jgi:hypothetical protein